ncbi:MAG: hypothetical protein DRP76_03755, partial [Candidatus Omnitrophota bacterium]
LIAEGENSLASNTGTIDVSAEESGADGGFVELSADYVDFASGIIDASSIDGSPGDILFDPWNIWIGDLMATWLESLDGSNVTLWAQNNIYMNLGNLGGDDILDLRFFDTEGFALRSGKHMFFNNDSIVTHGGGLTLLADHPDWYKAGFGYPKQWTNVGDGIGDIYLGSGSLITNGGRFRMKAGGNIYLDNGYIDSGGAHIDIVADAYYSYNAHPTTYDGPGNILPVYGAPGCSDTSDGIGNLYLGTGAGINSHGGVIDLLGVNIYLTSLVDAGDGLVNIIAQKDVLDDADYGAIDIIAGNLKISDLNTITRYFGKSNNFIETDINTLNRAVVTKSLYLKNYGDLYAKYVSAGENVRIRVNSDLIVGEISSSEVKLNAKSGSILDDLNDTTAIRANNISLTSQGTIGSSSTLGDMDAGYLDIALGTGALSLSSQGNIYLNEIAKANFLTSQVTNVNTGVSVHDVFLVNSAGDITVDSAITAEDNILLAALKDLNINADISTTANDIDLIALDNVKLAGNIFSSDYIGIQADFYSAYLNQGGDGTGAITQSAGIVGSGSEDLELSAGSGIKLDTAVSTLEAENTTSGDININNTGDLVIVDSGVNNSAKFGKVKLTTNSNLAVDANSQITTNKGNIRLEADEDIYVNNISTDGTFTGDNPPSQGIVRIVAGGDIQDNCDQNSTPIDSIYDISAKKIILKADGDIGTNPLAPIELRSKKLVVEGSDVNLFHKGELDFAGFDGNSFSLINAGDLTISGDITTSGDINLSVIEDPNLYINALLDSGGGNVNLSATENIVQNADILTQGGSFEGYADSDANDSGYYDLAFGSQISTNGGTALISGDDINLSGILDASTGAVTIQPSKDQTIALASGAAFGDFRLSNDEVDNILTSGLITIGSNQAGTITINNLNQPGRNFKLITSGDILEQGNEHSVDITADSLIFDVAGSVGTADNAIETEIGLLEGNIVNLINLNEFDDLALNTLTATDVILTLGKLNCCGGGAGALTDNNGALPNIIADTAILDTGTGIGSGNALETQLGTLNARVRNSSATDNIEIENTGDLNLDDLAGWGYSVNNLGLGDVYITTHSDLTILSPIKALGNMV